MNRNSLRPHVGVGDSQKDFQYVSSWVVAVGPSDSTVCGLLLMMIRSHADQ